MHNCLPYHTDGECRAIWCFEQMKAFTPKTAGMDGCAAKCANEDDAEKTAVCMEECRALPPPKEPTCVNKCRDKNTTDPEDKDACIASCPVARGFGQSLPLQEIVVYADTSAAKPRSEDMEPEGIEPGSPELSGIQKRIGERAREAIENRNRVAKQLRHAADNTAMPAEKPLPVTKRRKRVGGSSYE